MSIEEDGALRWFKMHKNYRVGYIVKAIKPAIQHGSGPEPDYWLRLCDSDPKYDIHVHSEYPEFLIEDVTGVYYHVRELTNFSTESIKVLQSKFDDKTRRIHTDMSEIKYANGETACKTITPCKQNGIRKYKRAVEICKKNLGEIINLPFVYAIYPFTYNDEVDNHGLNYDDEMRRGFAIKTHIHDEQCVGGYFVQDACDGWRWLSDEDWEKHKDDLITE